jgi:hypothetical protein
MPAEKRAALNAKLTAGGGGCGFRFDDLNVRADPGLVKLHKPARQLAQIVFSGPRARRWIAL